MLLLVPGATLGITSKRSDILELYYKYHCKSLIFAQVHKRKLFEVEKEIKMKMEAGAGVSKEVEAVPQARHNQEYQMKMESVGGSKELEPVPQPRYHNHQYQMKIETGGGSREMEAVPQPRYVQEYQMKAGTVSKPTEAALLPRYSQEYQMKVEAVPGHVAAVTTIQNSGMQEQPRYAWGIVDADPTKRDSVLTAVTHHRDS